MRRLFIGELPNRHLIGLERTFSVEIASKSDVRQMVISNHAGDSVLFEGSLGDLEDICLVEDVSLEVRGTKGVLRIDLAKDELKQIFRRKRKMQGIPKGEVGSE